MKLPKLGDKFLVTKTYYLDVIPTSTFVVSGVHIEIRADEDRPDFVWYCVYADKVHDDLFHSKILHVSLCLENALDYITNLTPYEEPEENADSPLKRRGLVMDERDLKALLEFNKKLETFMMLVMTVGNLLVAVIVLLILLKEFLGRLAV